MIETGVVLGVEGALHWHLPEGRTAGSIPDTRALWDVFWEHRKLDFLGFAHSHPGSGTPGPSRTDLTTFAAVEAGLGRRLAWWITSSNGLVVIRWRGLHRLDYRANPLVGEPDWVAPLRKLSEGLTIEEVFGTSQEQGKESQHGRPRSN